MRCRWPLKRDLELKTNAKIMRKPTDFNTLLWASLPALVLNAAQTAALCGISVRQLGYWTRQGYLAAQGQGARRGYNLDTVRRVLAIRRAMQEGASLRQALQQVPANLPEWGDSPPQADPPPSADLDALARGLRGFFEFNPHTRDHAGGLAVKLGRSEMDVRRAADHLCRAGFLRQSISQGMVIFRQTAPPVWQVGAAHD